MVWSCVSQDSEVDVGSRLISETRQEIKGEKERNRGPETREKARGIKRIDRSA